MTYEEAKLFKQKVQDNNNKDSAKLQTFEKNSLGMIPDHIRETNEWKDANEQFNKSFAELRNFNNWFVKAFKREIRADRKKRYSNK